MTATETSWDALHQDIRHRLVYPSEHVIRWLDGLPGTTALDIGCGHGRHTRLLRQQGWDVYGVDASREAAWRTARWFPADRIRHARMDALPFADDTFDIALAYGVFYYGTPDQADRAIAELLRVLKPGGQALVKVRTDRDWRAAHLANGLLNIPGEPEDGMTMHFLNGQDIERVYEAFTDVIYELTETTSRERTRRDSDWLITVTR